MSAIQFLEMTLVVRDKEQRLMMSMRARAGAKHSKSIMCLWFSRPAHFIGTKGDFFNLQQVGSGEDCLHSSIFSHPRHYLHQLPARTKLWTSEKLNAESKGIINADERTRTSTRLLPQRPERCASTNSATSAPEVGILLSGVETVKQPRFLIRVLLESRVARRRRTRNAHRSSGRVLRRRPTGRCG
jgi:hypothetical protein